VTSDELHITYLRSGGFAGVDMTAECVGPDLPEGQLHVATDLVRGAWNSAVPENPKDSEDSTPDAGRGADQFTYTVHLSEGPRHRTFHWSDGNVPDAVRPLLATLGGLAEPRARP
jgi:hypothetical protein